MQPLGLALQCQARREGLDAASAAAGAGGALQGHHDVAQLGPTEGAAVDQLVLVDDTPADTWGPHRDRTGSHRVKRVT